jgi:signal transduction histidine kinase
VIQRLRSTTIRSRLLRALLLASAVVAAMLAIVWRLTLEPALRLGVARSHQQVARRAADQIEEFLDRRIGELTAATEIGRLWEPAPDGHKETLYRLLKLSRPVEEVSLVDATGRETMRLSRLRVYTSADLRSWADDEAFRRARDGDVYVGDVTHGRTAEPIMTLAVPLRFTPVDIRGALIAKVNLATLWSPVSHMRLGQSGYGFVVDRHGTVIAHPDPSNVLMAVNMSAHPAVIRGLERSSDDVAEVHRLPDGRDVMTTAVRVARPQWLVVVEEPAATALAEVRRAERLAALLGLVALGGAFGISSWFSARVARPVRELTAGAALIAEGRLDQRLRVATGDELETLAGAFNEMGERLRESHMKLEAEVSQKTRDLSALYAITTPIGQSGDVARVLDDAVAKLIDVTGAEGVAIQVMHDGGALTAARGLTPLPPGDRLVTEALASRRPLTVDDVAVRGPNHVPSLTAEGFRTVHLLPLAIADRMVGWITLARRGGCDSGGCHAELLSAIAHQITVTVENARLYEDVRRALTEVRARNAELDTFVTSASHDLKTPLVAIEGMAGLLLEDYRGKLDATGVHYLERLRANTEQMGRLISDLLVLSRIGREARSEERVDMTELVHGLLGTLNGALSARRVRVSVGQLGVLTGIRTQLEQVMTNLVGNALKYSADVDTPTVEIGRVDRDGVAELFVRDNGVGIDAVYHDKIFDTFERLKEVEADGTGVGLAIVKKVLDAVGGRVWVESARGKGATFFFTWPLAARRP